MTVEQLRGGSYYRTEKGRIGRYGGVSYASGKHVELVDLQGKKLKAAVSALSPVHREVERTDKGTTVTFTEGS